MFEWDDDKRRLNVEKHGLDFAVVVLVFDGRPRVEVPARHGRESRILSVAKLDDVFLTIIWTWRDTSRRIISARRSRREEREVYNRLHP